MVREGSIVLAGAGACAVAQAAAAADALDMMVMALLRRADLGLEAEHLRADTCTAGSSSRFRPRYLLDPLDESVDHRGWSLR